MPLSEDSPELLEVRPPVSVSVPLNPVSVDVTPVVALVVVSTTSVDADDDPVEAPVESSGVPVVVPTTVSVVEPSGPDEPVMLVVELVSRLVVVSAGASGPQAESMVRTSRVRLVVTMWLSWLYASTKVARNAKSVRHRAVYC